MKRTISPDVLKRWQEVTDIPPQTVGPLTPYYKMVTKQLKTMPWLPFIIGGICVAIILYCVFGSSLPSFVGFLQRGF